MQASCIYSLETLQHKNSFFGERIVVRQQHYRIAQSQGRKSELKRASTCWLPNATCVASDLQLSAVVKLLADCVERHPSAFASCKCQRGRSGRVDHAAQ